uniref:Uncharacterized protein n=1 Tax=Naja naja TaxID=35670 RepID=A0A8C6XXK7_NAJNA
MGHQQLYCSHPRKYEQGSPTVCSNWHELICKYSPNMCR